MGLVTLNYRGNCAFCVLKKAGSFTFPPTQTLLDFLAELANKYDVQYLLQSRVLNTKRKR
ncbi:hypothetical protein B6175_13915 [Staphylococcus aureus]|nr:hypothetical protein B6175_13915 [Staphylococcus aureus]